MSHPDSTQLYWDNCDACNKLLPGDELESNGFGAIVCSKCMDLCVDCLREEHDPDFEFRCYECGFMRKVMAAEAMYEGDR